MPDITVCPRCKEPVHASESTDAGLCLSCADVKIAYRVLVPELGTGRGRVHSGVGRWVLLEPLFFEAADAFAFIDAGGAGATGPHHVVSVRKVYRKDVC